VPVSDDEAAKQLANLLRFEHFFGAYEVCIDVGMSHADALECARSISGVAGVGAEDTRDEPLLGLAQDR
jgi:hypothetical protein